MDGLPKQLSQKEKNVLPKKCANAALACGGRVYRHLPGENRRLFPICTGQGCGKGLGSCARALIGKENIALPKFCAVAGLIYS